LTNKDAESWTRDLRKERRRTIRVGGEKAVVRKKAVKKGRIYESFLGNKNLGGSRGGRATGNQIGKAKTTRSTL